MDPTDQHNQSIRQGIVRFYRWGRLNAQLLATSFAVSAAVIGTTWAVSGTISTLKRDLEHEKENRQKDVATAYEQGRVFTLQQVLAEKNHIVEMAFAEEYKTSRGQK